MTKIKISDSVEEKIIEIQRYILTYFANPKAALKVRKEIMKPIRLLSHFPESGNLITNIYGNAHPKYRNYRRLIAGNYVILYFHDSSDDTCYVDFIFDSRTNYSQTIID